MDNTSFRSLDSPQGDNYAYFEFSELLEFDDWAEVDPTMMTSGYPINPVYVAPNEVKNNVTGSSNHLEASNGSNGSRPERKEKVTFRTMTEIEILDDGFKWRKYGKKMVKNSPNPSLLRHQRPISHLVISVIILLLFGHMKVGRMLRNVKLVTITVGRH